MFNRIVNYLQHYNLLHPSQHGFREGRSTTSAALQLIQSICQAINNHHQVIGIFYDLSKAFDNIDHSILSHKLLGMGISGIAHSWLMSFLSNRQQIVQWKS